MRKVIGESGAARAEGTATIRRSISLSRPSLMTLARIARACSLAAILVTPLAALADDYADVNQLAKQGKYADALAKADQYLATKPRDPQMRFLKGVIQAESGKRTEAITTYTQLTQEYPELAEPYNNLAVLYAQDNEYDKAREALEGAVRANPSYATAYENLGDVYAKLASQSYAKAQQIAPADKSAAEKLALVKQLLANPPKR
jgi:tetratricopeptide (TPR) repeat protein